MKLVCSLIVVNDITKARYFYEKLLGQAVKYDFGENIQFDGGFAIHAKDHFAKLINTNSKNIFTKKAHNFELYFESAKLEEISLALKKADIEFIHDIVEPPWGQRVFRIYDYDSHIVEIGESMEAVVIRLYNNGSSKDEIVSKTSMPAAFVEDTIKTYLD